VEYSLVPTDGQEDLAEIQRQKFESALRNLVTGKTPKEDFPGGVIPQRPIRGGAQVDYIPGWWFIQQANALFSYFWDHEVLDQFIGEKQVWTKNRVTVKVPGRTVIEKFPDGRILETRYEPISVSKTQFGGSDIKRYSEGPKSGQVMDIADDLKSSSTDGMKKCFAEFGFGADVYGKRELLEKTGTTRSQLETLYKIGEKKGMTKEQVDVFFDKETEGKSPTEVEQVVILGLIQKLRNLKQ